MNVPVPKPGAVSGALAPKATRPNLDAVRAAVAALNEAIDAAFAAGANVNIYAVCDRVEDGRFHTLVGLDPRGPLKPGERLPGGFDHDGDDEGWQLIPGTNIKCRDV